MILNAPSWPAAGDFRASDPAAPAGDSGAIPMWTGCPNLSKVRAAMADKSLTYRDSGVDIDAGDELVERIKPLVARVRRPEVLAGIGGFGALVEIGRAHV